MEIDKNLILSSIDEKYDEDAEENIFNILKINLGIKFTGTARQFAEKLSKTNNENENWNILEEIVKGEYEFYLQNATKENDREYKVALLLASDSENKKNLELIKNLKEKIICFEGVNYNGNFLITTMRILPFSVGTKLSKSIYAKINFFTESSIRYSGMPQHIMNRIISLPNAQLLRKKVDKNIKDWDNYLEIIEKQALDSEVFIKYNGYRIEPSLVHCTFDFDFFSKEEIEKLKKFRNERIKLISYNHESLDELIYDENEEDNVNDSIDNISIEFNDVIGNIEKINYNNFSIKVELEPDFQEMAQEKKLVFPKNGHFKISKLGDLSQVRKLRKGLKNLKNGRGINPDLDCLLFDSNSYSEANRDILELSDKDLLLDTLNFNQKKAVEGVLNSEEIFLIQGPPGTGKTTVIAEICYQNAIRGKRTLISSQSNLAVDNALSRLLHNPKIRIIREGNVSKVEKEGEKYTKANVVDTWLEKTAIHCEMNSNPKKDFMINLNELLNEIEKIDLLKNKIIEFSNEIKKNKKDIEENEIYLKEIKKYQEKLDSIFTDVIKQLTLGKSTFGIIDKTIISSRLENILSHYSSFYKDEKIKDLLKAAHDCEHYLQKNHELNKNIIYVTTTIEKLNEIKNYVEYNQFKMIYVSIDLDYDIKRLILFIKEMDVKLKKHKELNIKLLSNINKIKNIKGIIQNLKNNFKLKEIFLEGIETINSNKEYDKILENINIEIQYLESNKPNKLLLYLGFRKKWIKKLFLNLKKLNLFEVEISEEIMQIEVEIQENEKVIVGVKKTINSRLDILLKNGGIEKNELEEVISKTLNSIDVILSLIDIEYSNFKNIVLNKILDLKTFITSLAILLEPALYN